MQNCRSSTERPSTAAKPDDDDDDDDDDDEPAEDMDAYVESGKLEAEDNVMIYMLSLLISQIVNVYGCQSISCFIVSDEAHKPLNKTQRQDKNVGQCPT